MAAEVFNCELSKINDLFFTSREEFSGEDKPAKKEIQSSPLPRDHEDDDEDVDEEEQGEDQDKEDEEEEAVETASPEKQAPKDEDEVPQK